MNDPLAILVIKIIKTQEGIIGPLAIEQAQKIPGLQLDWNNQKVEFKADKKSVLEALVKKYETIFGRTSLEVCREVYHSISAQIPKDQVPSLFA